MKRVVCRFSFAAATIVLAGALGCAKPPPPIEPALTVTVPTGWTAADSAQARSDSTSRIDEIAWWSSFEDMALDSLVHEALVANHDLRAAVARVDIAFARAKIAGADLYPQLGLGGVAGRQKQNFIGLPVGGGSEVLSTTTNSYRLSLDASWELDLWGRIRAGQSAALADAEGARALAAGAQLSIAGRTAKVWYAVTETRLQLRLAEETVESFEDASEYIRQRYSRGLRSALDLRLALSDLGAAKAAREAIRIRLDRNRRSLETLLGRYPAGAVAGTDSLPPVPGPVPAGLPAQLVSRRPDLVEAERQAAAAGARVKEARRAFYPQVSLTGSAGVASNVIRDLTDGDFGVWSIAGSLLQPIFQGGRLRGQLSAAEATMVAAIESYANSVLEAYAEVETAIVREALLGEREADLADAVRHAIAAQSLAEQQYDRGLVDIITVLEARRRAILRQSDLITVRRDRLDTRIDLHLALGGGFHADDIRLSPADDSAAARDTGDSTGADETEEEAS